MFLRKKLGNIRVPAESIDVLNRCCAKDESLSVQAYSLVHLKVETCLCGIVQTAIRTSFVQVLEMGLI